MQMFPPPRPAETYNPALRTLHWLMALVIFGALGLGVWATQLPRGDLRSEVLFIHKSLGVAALGLLVLRVLVRFAVAAPAYAVPLGRLVGAAAGSAHLLLYALMIAMPVSGYLMSSADGHDVSFSVCSPSPTSFRTRRLAGRRPRRISSSPGRSGSLSSCTSRRSSGTPG